MHKKILVLIIALVAGLPAACGSNPTAPTPAASMTTVLSLSSDPVSFIGQTRSYNLQTATFQPLVLRNGGGVAITVRPTAPSDRSGPWTWMMGSPFGRGLASGTYATTGFTTDADYSFDILSPDVICGGNGTVTIHELAIVASVLQRFRASFTLRCGSATVRGEVVILADPWR